MREPPPSRYRVVERGRRLEVIDTWHGEKRVTPKVAAPMPSTPPRPGNAPVASTGPAPQIDARGRRRVTTAAWYDAKGPRELLLDSDGERQFENARAILVIAAIVLLVLAYLWWVLLIPLAIFLGQPKVRGKVQEGVAGWLDSIAAESA